MSADPWHADGADPWAKTARSRIVGPSAHAQPPLPVQAAAGEWNAWQDYKQGTGGNLPNKSSSIPPNAYQPRDFGPDRYRNGGGHNGHNGDLFKFFGGQDRGRRHTKIGTHGERLEVIDWQGIEIVPVTKDFSFEHPSVSARTEGECEAIRAANSIHVLSKGTAECVPRPISRFEEAPFPDWAAAELRRNGFDKPTAIQVQAWPSVLRGHDFVGIAETGSGKTIAYVLPMLVHIMAQPELRPGEGPIGLVIVPTRDLCMQVTKQIESFVACTNIVCRAIYGGEDIDRQAKDLAKRMDIAVATPGRLIALLNNQVTNLRRATFVVLDEADELLDQGFGEQVCLVLSQVRPDRQALLFSATWPTRVERLAGEVCNQSPIHVNVGSVKMSACKAIKQRFHRVLPEEKKEKLLCQALSMIENLILGPEGYKALIFCNTRHVIQPVVDELKARNYPVESFHGDRTQSDRDEVLRRFTSPDSDVRLLVCTQILGRGHDFQNVRYVINYDMPSKVVEYIHRIGRTGRAGQSGYSLTFLADTDLHIAKDLVMVLKESEQDVPEWLQTASKHQRRYRELRFGAKGGGKGGYGKDDNAGRDVRNGQSNGIPSGWANGSPQPIDGGDARGDWAGRGQNRRRDFLSECKGTGAARQWLEEPQ